MCKYLSVIHNHKPSTKHFYCLDTKLSIRYCFSFLKSVKKKMLWHLSLPKAVGGKFKDEFSRLGRVLWTRLRLRATTNYICKPRKAKKALELCLEKLSKVTAADFDNPLRRSLKMSGKHGRICRPVQGGTLKHLKMFITPLPVRKTKQCLNWNLQVDQDRRMLLVEEWVSWSF